MKSEDFGWSQDELEIEATDERAGHSRLSVRFASSIEDLGQQQQNKTANQMKQTLIKSTCGAMALLALVQRLHAYWMIVNEPASLAVA